MGKKRNTNKEAPVHRRTFLGVRLDAALERELRQAKALGYPMEWKEDATGLTVSRDWVEGRDYRQIFGELNPQQRTLSSRELFSHALERLGDLQHGALHPGNVLHVGSAPVFLDPVANAARLGGVLPPIYAVWLWAPRIPADWEVSDWDRVNLLRMAELLAQGPASWETALPQAEMVELCRRWAKTWSEELTAGDDRAASLQRVLTLLQRLKREPESRGSITIASLLASSLKRRGKDRMLRPADEAEILARAQETGTGLGDELLTVELLLRGAQRQSELRRQAKAFLKAGAYPGTVYVKRSARRNAERLYHAYGVSEEEAITEVQLLLAELGLFDEADVQTTWSGLVDEYIERHCRRGYSRGHLQKMMALVGTCKLPGRVAELQLLRYLTQEKKLRERSGFFRIG